MSRRRQQPSPILSTTASLIGTSKYGTSFERYDYVNPDAPKGGTLNTIASGAFDSFNPFIVRGAAAEHGSEARPSDAVTAAARGG